MDIIRSGLWNPYEIHKQVSDMYSWHDVAKRTDAIYQTVMKHDQISLADRFVHINRCGLVAGKFGVMIIAVNHILWLFLEWLNPRENIDIAPKFDQELFHEEVNHLNLSKK